MPVTKLSGTGTGLSNQVHLKKGKYRFKIKHSGPATVALWHQSQDASDIGSTLGSFAGGFAAGWLGSFTLAHTLAKAGAQAGAWIGEQVDELLGSEKPEPTIYPIFDVKGNSTSKITLKVISDETEADNNDIYCYDGDYWIGIHADDDVRWNLRVSRRRIWPWVLLGAIILLFIWIATC